MRRRKAVKAIALGSLTPQLIFSQTKRAYAPSTGPDAVPSFQSNWREWPDMKWCGPEYWGNRLQDWQIKDGRAVCVVSGPNRTLHMLTAQLSSARASLETGVTLEWLNDALPSADNYAGFLVGAKGKFNDYRSAAVFGQGLVAGIDGEGRLRIGEQKSSKVISMREPISLSLQAVPQGERYTIVLRALSPANKQVLDEIRVDDVLGSQLEGNIALTCHAASGNSAAACCAFADWTIAGGKVTHDADHSFGPVCFAQYTLHDKILKLTAQLAPVEAVPGHRVSLEIRDGDEWKTLQRADVGEQSRVARFRVERWSYTRAVPYRVKVALPLKSGMREYSYEGEVAAEPLHALQVKMAVFSCNCDYGFPDADVPMHVAKHKPDLAVFLGDQFYESTGGFGVDRNNAALDYLRKWYMFGWSYRDIFRKIPSITIPDDHDVYHGNVWGEGGKVAPTDEGFGYVAQDQGGYKMPSQWVNMVQECQTSHLPDPYDPTPVKQGIGVYYTDWCYGGVSMAILEDRKFKSAPKNVLPAEAKVVNGFIQNRDFNIREYYDIEAELLGERQLGFLNDWAADWKNAEMKVVLSQTNFCTVATLPEGSIIDEAVPRLPIPEEGEYVAGDAPTTDMDSNGWPQKGRDEALRVIRKAFALHIAGDQHLASVVHYGIDDYGDAGYAFAGPALNNLWPRRWWPPVEGHEPLKGQPAYTGSFLDGFGNRMTVVAVANPRKTDVSPALIHDRATGYGIVTFDKENRTMTLECWPRYVDPEKNPSGQFGGWPITITQEQNYGRKPAGYLPELNITGATDPVVQVINEGTGNVEYTLRIRGTTFAPKVFAEGTYTVKVSDPENGREKVVKGVKLARRQGEVLRVEL